MIANKPTRYELSQNHPYPFNPTTIINYQLPIDNWVTLKVYDVLGREVVVLVGEIKESGYHCVSWDASDIPSGVYIYKISSGGFTDVKKMLLIR